ncbi:hemin uptake protein HemP [Hydrogenophaga laconesensis]|uniref:Hemin uptake protein HemP n=1 Tax=Hydrogenophaga laconesensis TaxID=1805971 RepID=A0ABU1VA20_9BURK|nr:hemin uptake protein HemP [Hydrogenophaga laconesensis]MDR7094190.1 hemin uptake protein HemP [Hydrogenophaga laconesensis]
MNPTPNTSPAPNHVPAPEGSPAHDDQCIAVLPSAELLRGQRAVAIDHNGSLYRLQTTRQGKLILTK